MNNKSKDDLADTEDVSPQSNNLELKEESIVSITSTTNNISTTQYKKQDSHSSTTTSINNGSHLLPPPLLHLLQLLPPLQALVPRIILEPLRTHWKRYTFHTLGNTLFHLFPRMFIQLAHKQ